MTEGELTPGPARASTLEQQQASVLGGGRTGTTSGWIIKILLLGVADAIAITGLVMAIDHEAWGYVAVLGVSLVALNAIYLPRRFVPMKYLFPGLFFLTVFGIYPVLYTAYASTTNYGTGHVLSKSQAIDQIQSQSVQPVEGATRYDITPMKDATGVFAGFALFDPEGEQLFLGTDTELTDLDLDDAQLTTLQTTGRTFVESAGDLTGVRAGDVRTLPGYPDPETYQMPGESEDSAITITGGQAVESRSTLVYDADANTITDFADAENPIVYHEREGTFVADDGTALRPGFTSRVGFDNYREVFTSSQFQGAFFRVLAWNLAFAFASVVVTFALGLLLAVVFNEPRMRGRKIYRSLIIIPYALPGFMTALVWRGMFNETYGINRWLPFDVSWQSSTLMAMTTLILVNMWLGYPYMFLVSTGALQSVPTDLKEAAFVDGATGWKAFRKITFPLLLVSVSPLLVASFAFNFNNFTLVWLLTGGRPRDTGETAGTTDILLSWVYRVALDASPQRQGLAAALSVIIFLIVAVISAIGFKYTKAYEEVK
jgi:arabinogalactan oligomer / maltooligosaccharide transport system permease protein